MRLPASLRFGRDTLNVEPTAWRREWLVTNGIGGYASSSLLGINMRRYHGLLVASLAPPLGRTVLLAKLEDVAVVHEQRFGLSANAWADGTLAPRGFEHIDGFVLEGTIPCWHYTLADAVLSKRIWMEPRMNVTYVQYRLNAASAPVRLELFALVNYRDFHATSRAGEWTMKLERDDGGLAIVAFERAVPWYLRTDRGQWQPEHVWYRDLLLPIETERGVDDREDVLRAGSLVVTLAPGDAVTIAATTDRGTTIEGDDALARRATYELELIARAGAPEDTRVRQLVVAADQFVVQRRTDADPGGMSILAGYPWFGDWGRDAMIALPGLTLATGRPEVCARVLRTFAKLVDHGLVPSHFTEDGRWPEYDAADATLWYFEAIRIYVEATEDYDLLDELMPVLVDIVRWHRRGTRHGIRVDADGLLRAGEDEVPLTWMVTPRAGKPVEVNALWFNALMTMQRFAEQTGESPEEYGDAAEQTRQGLQRFWSEEHGFCFDVIDGPDGDDPRLRPNQIFMVALPYSPFAHERQRAIVDVCARELYTPHGLRSLAAREPDFLGRYMGGLREREAAYHQGTVWAWLMGPFARAFLRVYPDERARVRLMLEPLLRHLGDHGVGSISEIFDGAPPFTPRGAVAQAWSVAELLSTWRALE